MDSNKADLATTIIVCLTLIAVVALIASCSVKCGGMR